MNIREVEYNLKKLGFEPILVKEAIEVGEVKRYNNPNLLLIVNQDVLINGDGKEVYSNGESLISCENVELSSRLGVPLIIFGFRITRNTIV